MKFTVTEVLVSYIKEKRKEQNITVTSFAEKIGKSKSYITKFDNCEFKTLTLEDFKKIFLVLANDLEEIADELMEQYFLSLIKNDYAEKNVDLMVDVSNYGNIVRESEIPVNLVKKLNQMLESKNLSVHEIVEIANSNEAVKDFPNYDLIEYNEYNSIPVTVKTEENNNVEIYIKIKLDENFVSSILDGKTTFCNYMTLLAIANAYYRHELLKSESEKIRENINILSLMSAHNLLFNFQLYALEDHFKVEKSKNNIQKLSTDLGKISHSMQNTLVTYMKIITKVYEQDPFYAEDKVTGFRKNLESDPAFCIATMDLPFNKAKKLNTDNKKKLLKEISELIDRYASDEEYKEQIDLI